MKGIHVLSAFIASVLLVLIPASSFAEDGKRQGQPFQALQQQIDELKAQMENNLKQINVYDDDDQYLGVLLGHETDRIHVPPGRPITEIFVPELNYSTFIEGRTGNIASCLLVFESENCVGEKSYMFNSGIICREGSGAYVVGLDPLAVATGFFNSVLRENGGCSNQTQQGGTYFQSLHLSPEQLPFTLPVAVPLHYQTK